MRKILEPERLRDYRNTVNPNFYYQRQCRYKSPKKDTHSDMKVIHYY